MSVANHQVRDHEFLAAMVGDPYYPAAEVEKACAVLIGLCEQIEAESPTDLTSLYQLTHAATEDINGLQESFEEAGSEIETMARDCIGMDFAFIARAYGFADADVEELIAPRDW